MILVRHLNKSFNINHLLLSKFLYIRQKINPTLIYSINQLGLTR